MQRNAWYFVLPVVAFIISTLGYILFVNSFHHLGIEANRLEAILDFYPSLPEGSTLFLGESQVREDLDCHKMDQFFHSNSCFNLGLAGILPLQLALQKDFIIQAKPKTVVIGVSSVFFDESSNKNDDLFLLLGEHKQVTRNDFVMGLLSNQEKKLVTMNFYERAVYKRKFIVPFFFSFFKNLFSDSSSDQADQAGQVNLGAIYDFKNPHFFNTMQNSAALEQKMIDPKFKTIFEIENSSVRERSAFLFLVKELQKEGIKVIIIKMPLHPLVTQNVPPSSQQAFDRFISKTAETLGAEAWDYEKKYAAQDFNDLTHLTSAGEEKFTDEIAHRLVADNLTRGDSYPIQ